MISYPLRQCYYKQRPIGYPWPSDPGNHIAGSSNLSSRRHGLNEIARMLADGMITARIRSTVELDDAGKILERLRNGGLRGKAVIPL